MSVLLDLDQLKTFVAIADSGSFTRAADLVHKTQSAVSMQMRRLEERIGKPIFLRDGRASRLTEDGERLLGYARRMLRLSAETMAAFDDQELAGHVRLGTPDDYADRFLPEILARFARSHPRVEVSVVCQPTVELTAAMRSAMIDLAIVTHVRDDGPVEVIRQEPLFWVASAQHRVEGDDVVPLALGRDSCEWRRIALDGLSSINRPHRLLYSSTSATATAAAVLAGLAVTILPESALRPGMRILGEREGFPKLPFCEIGMMRSWLRPATPPVEALAGHIQASLGNLSAQLQAAE
jgi:DNA-binding transcriptional LysR family regulator